MVINGVDTHGIYPGCMVKHFKKELHPDSGLLYCYKVKDFGTETETQEKVVIYEALYSNDRIKTGQIFVRPLKMFFSEVDHEKYPSIHQRYRFELIQFDDHGNTVNC